MRRLILLSVPLLALACNDAETRLTPKSRLADKPVQTTRDLPPAAPHAAPAEGDAPAPEPEPARPLEPTASRPEPKPEAPDPNPAYVDLEAEVAKPTVVLRPPDRTDVPIAEGADRGDDDPSLRSRGQREPSRVDRGDVEPDLTTQGDREPELVDKGERDRSLVDRGDAEPDLTTNPGPARADPTPYLPPSAGTVGFPDSDAD